MNNKNKKSVVPNNIKNPKLTEEELQKVAEVMYNVISEQHRMGIVPEDEVFGKRFYDQEFWEHIDNGVTNVGEMVINGKLSMLDIIEIFKPTLDKWKNDHPDWIEEWKEYWEGSEIFNELMSHQEF